MVRIMEIREPKTWRVRVRAKVPSRWPKGQSVMDRLYWIDAALQNVEPFTAEYRRLNGLYAQALGIL